MNIFISFSTEDLSLAKTLFFSVKEICRMEDIISSVFFADQSIKGGQNWLNVLNEEINKSDMVLFLWTSNSSNSIGQIIELGASWILGKDLLLVLHNNKPGSLPFILRDIQSIPWETFPRDFHDILFKLKNTF